jgi:hypothetical protein
VLEHVPRGSRASVSLALGRVLTNFCSLKTWESLRDLLGFAKTVLAAPKRGGVRRMPAVEREVILRANAIGCSPFEDLWARSSTTGRGQTAKSKLPPKPKDGDTAHTAIPDNQVSRICSLVAEGAISKACKHLLSTGLYDPADPRVSRTQHDLHPHSPPRWIPPPWGRTSTAFLDFIGTGQPGEQQTGCRPSPQPLGGSHLVREGAPPAYARLTSKTACARRMHPPRHPSWGHLTPLSVCAWMGTYRQWLPRIFVPPIWCHSENRQTSHQKPQWTSAQWR